MSTTLTTTPAADGFRMPGEFEPHSGCWMLWPERPSNWRRGAKPAQEAFAAVRADGAARAFGRFEQEYVERRAHAFGRVTQLKQPVRRREAADASADDDDAPRVCVYGFQI